MYSQLKSVVNFGFFFLLYIFFLNVEHFYLETNCTIVLPTDAGCLEIYSSTQNPTKTQNFCASVCGLPANKVTAKCKRMGGGFGGKETRSVFIAVTAALAAHILQRLPICIHCMYEVLLSNLSMYIIDQYPLMWRGMWT